jgi:hypothetical protein
MIINNKAKKKFAGIVAMVMLVFSAFLIATAPNARAIEVSPQDCGLMIEAPRAGSGNYLSGRIIRSCNNGTIIDWTWGGLYHYIDGSTSRDELIAEDRAGTTGTLTLLMESTWTSGHQYYTRMTDATGADLKSNVAGPFG